MIPYDELDATGMADLIRSGEVSAKEMVEKAISSIESVDATLNAVTWSMAETALKQAEFVTEDQAFGGVPFVIKDLDLTIAGLPYGAGSRFFEGYRAADNSTVIDRFRGAGLIFVAKTATPELGIMGITEPEIRGPTRNPWNPDHTPGGSSGGTAALVGARAVPAGHASDGGGSIRIPASHCGLFGLKPSRGRVPHGPGKGEGWGGFATSGILTRTVRDCAGLLDVISGDAPHVPFSAPHQAEPFTAVLDRPPRKLRVAFTTGSLYGSTTHAACAANVRETARLLEQLGHEVEEARPDVDREALVWAYLVQVGASVAGDIDKAARTVGREPTAVDFEAPTWFLRQVGQTLRAVDLNRSRELALEAAEIMANFHQRYDLFMLPTVAHPPVRVGELALKSVERWGLAALRKAPVPRVLKKVLADLAEKSLERTPNTQLFNQTGQPAMSVPLGQTPSGMPLGVQFAAPFGDEATLLSLAAQLEGHRPWIGRKPVVCAS